MAPRQGYAEKGSKSKKQPGPRTLLAGIKKRSRELSQTLEGTWIHHYRIPGWIPGLQDCDTLAEIEQQILAKVKAGRPEVDVIIMNASDERHSPWVSFEDGRHKAIIVDNLRGCTAAIAYSRKGMMAAHLWEGQVDEDTGNDHTMIHFTGDSLCPGQGSKPLRQYLVKVRDHFADKKDELSGGGTTLVIPRTSDGYKYRYDIKKWPLFNYQGRVYRPSRTTQVKAMSEMIKATVRRSTRNQITQEHGYPPLEWYEDGELEAARKKDPSRMCLAVVCNPTGAVPINGTVKTDPIKKTTITVDQRPASTVQVWFEETPLLVPPYS